MPATHADRSRGSCVDDDGVQLESDSRRRERDRSVDRVDSQVDASFAEASKASVKLIFAEIAAGGTPIRVAEASVGSRAGEGLPALPALEESRAT